MVQPLVSSGDVTADHRRLAKLFANKFISRPDVIAVQGQDGEYRPDRKSSFDMPNLLAHLNGERTLGHYLVSQRDTVKLFVLDLDIKKGVGLLPTYAQPDAWDDWQEVDLRAHWTSRQQGPGRDALKYWMRTMAQRLVRASQDILSVQDHPIQSVATYSGSKGVHVYTFFDAAIPSGDARDAAKLVLASCDYEVTKGNNFFAFTGYHDDDYDAKTLAKNFELEIYPKQDSIADKPEHLGNLVRLPLGRNLKAPKDKPFFIDLRTELADMRPMDPIYALTTPNIWAHPEELPA